MTPLQKDLENYFDRLWPICRSITGNGLRESLRILSEIIPLQLHEVPTGTQVFDWTIPKEWNISEAYIVTPDGKKICDLRINNLHVVNYSVPIVQEMELEALLPHLHSLPDQPDAIPYITSYYKETWGFCLTHNELRTLKKGRYKVVINSTLQDGSLTYGDFVLKGDTDEEVLLSTYVCHPSMANNELSGPLVLAFLYQQLKDLPERRYTYRFVFAPETVGVIAYLAKTGAHIKNNTVAGYVLTCCGDKGPFVYKMSKHEDSLADIAAKHVLKFQRTPFEIIPFSVGGSDERQYCSPGFNLPVGSLTRSMYQRYKEYHTSLDNKSFISFHALEETVGVYVQILKAIEMNRLYKNAQPFCEPQLGKRGLYPNAVSPDAARTKVHNMMHLISFADGTMPLIDIANKKNISVFDLEESVKALLRERVLLHA